MQAREEPAGQDPERPRVRILVLEDDASYAALVGRHLAGAPWVTPVVEVAGTLDDALARLAGPGVDLVIADLNVPDSQGAGTIAALAAACQQPIIAITADDDPKLRAQAMRAGAYEFLPKRTLDAASLGSHVRLAAMQAQALRSLKASEARFRGLTAVSSDWYWELDEELRFVADAEEPQFAGQRSSRRKGRTPWEVYPADLTAQAWRAHRATLEAHEPFHDLEYERREEDGTRRWVSVSGHPVFDAGGAFRGYRGVGRDITERKKAERRLALEHRIARALAESRPAPETLLEIMVAICEAESWDCGRYYTVDERLGKLRLDLAWATSDAMRRFNAESEGVTIARGEGLAGAVWAEGEALWVPDVARDGRTANRAIAERAGVHGAFLFPVASEGRVLGVLSFSSAFVREPEERLQQTTRVIGSQVGRFLRHKEAESALRAKDAQLRLIMDSVPATLAYCDAQERFLYTNRAHAQMYGYPPGSATGRTVREVMGERAYAAGDENRRRVLQGETVTYELTYQDAAGQERIRSIHQVPELDEAGRVTGYFSLGTDITEHKRAEERVRYLAHHDVLTGLPNRLLFQDRVGQAITQAQRTRSKVAVLFIDLDHFKHINDSLGHPVGDRLLQDVAGRLQRCVREGDSVCRLGGDEFVISLPGLADSQAAALVAAKVLEALDRAFEIEGRELHVGGSIGISVAPEDGLDAAALMRAADTAMYHAKERGRGSYHFYTEALNAAAQQRLELASQLRLALSRGEFVLHYQPQVDLGSGRIFAVEALLRWQRPGEAPMSCAGFISVAEETGLILPIGDWVLREACAQLKRWRTAGAPDLMMAVNLSARQFYQASFAEAAAQALAAAQLPASALELEITESVLLLPNAENLATLQRLSAMGVRLTVDDFGTGYSSLAYLQRFPLHGLKIDRGFVAGIGRDTSHTAIVTAIIAMAQSLRLSVVAEGVEEEGQVAFLRERGCRFAQGFYFGRPMEADALAARLGLK
ncbi:MAG TPA: EAL domain-containing protein [Burkholderiales bacterium]|nr:EAL domain-containing protein [Burkholderiales bacterium]